jgi:hypothetical protein
MLEYWINGFWNTAILGKCSAGEAIKSKMNNILCKPIIPSFHYSIIPLIILALSYK